MKLLLDTNVCVHQLRVKGDARVKQRFAAANPSHMVLCTPVISELLMIAAIALVHGLTLVTHNTAEFSRVPGLVLEDWETP